MLKYLAKRVARSLLTLFFILTIVFVLVRQMPIEGYFPNFEKMTPSRELTLEECLEFAREDECVEVTPEVVRIRKVILDQNERSRAYSRNKNG